jgi:hypothetical protein
LNIENFLWAFAISLVFCLIACTETTTKTETSYTDTIVGFDDTTLDVESGTTSINNNWIYDTLVNRNTSDYEERTVLIKKNVRLNDSVFYVLYAVSGPVSSTQYVLPFINNKPQQHEMISETADADFSIPYYDYTEYEQSSDTLFKVFHYHQKVKYPDKVLTKDGHFKEGFDFDNVDIKADTLITKMMIHSNGSISKMN